MDRTALADFLRTRREALRPEDVGLPRGPRRRTPGLRREEVAHLAGMSADYYARLEQRRGPQPSPPMLAAVARALRLDAAQRDHLFRLAGHAAPPRAAVTDHVAPGLLRILDRLQDTPAEVISELGETLVQTPAAVALLGDRTRLTGLDRAVVHRWFTDPSSRDVYPAEDHELRARGFVAELRALHARDGRGSRADAVVRSLLARSPEFAALWADHEVQDRQPRTKRLQHPEVGVMTLDCASLLDTTTGQRLLVFTATPGSVDADRLALVAVIGSQLMTTPTAGRPGRHPVVRG